MSAVTVPLVFDEANFFDFLAARTVVPVIVQFDSNELPFGLCYVKSGRLGQWQDVCFEILEVVLHGLRVPLKQITMLGPIRIRAGPAHFCPYNTLL